MPNIYDNRRANLVALVSKYNNAKSNRGGMMHVAKTTGIAHVSISTIISGVPKTAKDHKKPFKAQMGAEMARKIESAFMCEPGSFDLPVECIAMDDLSVAQGRLLQAMENRMRSGVLSDKDCEIELAKLQELYPVGSNEDFNVESHQMFLGNSSWGVSNFFTKSPYSVPIV